MDPGVFPPAGGTKIFTIVKDLENFTKKFFEKLPPSFGFASMVIRLYTTGDSLLRKAGA
jgi:hypothetical protein